MKLSSEHIEKCLSQIYTSSFCEGIVPDKLKSAVIYPIHKGETKMLCSNYRPISILPIFNKILEKLMHKRLTSFLDRHNILYTHQYGFQRGKSTDHAILDLHTNIIKAVEDREKSCSIFLDFAKAFDTVNHDILPEKLKYYGICGLRLNWFKSCLSGRYQCVKINNAKSDNQSIVGGVPQGSVLGPLPFLIYINDKSAPTVCFRLFADDTSLFYSNKSYKKMEIKVNISLDNIANWVKANKLTLNVKKSNLLVFDSRKSSKEKPPVKLFINDEELEQKDFAKYLGVYFNKQLSWSKHIEITNNKLHKVIGILPKPRKYVQEETIKNLFNSFLKPYIEYGNLAWGGAPKNKIELINRSIKVLLEQ